MKNLIICLAFLLPFMTSCKKETEGNSFVTYIPVLEIKGESVISLNLGDSYTDEGIDSASINGVDCKSQVKVTGAVNTSETGLYEITYKLFNTDGFSASETRRVFVGDFKNFSGSYPASVVRNAAGYSDMALEISKGSADDLRNVSDLLGGFYSQGRAYGQNFAMQGVIKLIPDGSKYKLELVESHIPGWGDSADSIEGEFDPATGEFSWICSYADMLFNVTKQ